MKPLYFLFFLITCGVSYAQSPVKLWTSIYDGNLDGKDIARSVITDQNGNVYVTGTSIHLATHGSFATVKYDTDGIEMWNHHHTGSQTSSKNKGEKILVDKFGDIYAGGTVAIASGDLALVKYSPDGFLWAENYTPSWFGSYIDAGVDMAIDTSGNIYLVGVATSTSGNLNDVYTVKCDASGNTIWEDDYTGASAEDYPTGIAVTATGNVYAVAASFNFWGSATHDIATIHYTPTGAEDWTAYYNGADDQFDYPTFIAADDNGNTYVTGSADAGANRDFVVLKQNSFGSQLWNVTYNGTANSNDTALVARYLSNGDVIATGRTKELSGSNTYDAITTMFISGGSVAWTQTFTGSEGIGAVPKAMILDNFGNIYVCGYEVTSAVAKNGCILKYDVNGTLLWQESFDTFDLDDIFTDITLDNQNNIVVTGQTYSSATNANYVTVKYAQSLILSVDLVDFAATAEEQSILLTWKTLSETDNSGFAIERTSSPEENYETISWIPGKGDATTVTHYQYEDFQAKPGARYYYRLKQVDHDGSWEYSPLVSAMMGTKNFSLSVTPNPYLSETSISYVLTNKAKVNLAVFNLQGQPVAILCNGMQDEGMHSFDFNGEEMGYGNGTYILRLSINDNIYFTRMVQADYLVD